MRISSIGKHLHDNWKKVRTFNVLSKHFYAILLLIVGLFLLVSTAYWWIFVRHQEIHGLHGFYYANTTWQDPLWKSGLLDTDISSGSQDFRQAKQDLNNRFSIEWRGYIQIPATDNYTFATNSDDGSWIFIDDKRVVDNGGSHGLQEVEGTIHLSKGLHKIRIRYFQIGGYARLEVFWAKDREPKTPLPAEMLFPPDTRLARFWYSIMKKGFLILMTCLGIGLIIGESLLKNGDGPSPSKQRSFIPLLVVCIFIPFWQSTFALTASKLDDSYRMRAAGGLYTMNQYLYFYYYLNLFPLAPPGGQALDYSKQGAETIVREHPAALVMGKPTGSYGRIWLFFPAAFLKGEPSDLNVVWVNAVLFTMALIGLLVAAWQQDKLVLGLLLVAFIGSHPFQLYEIYATHTRSGGTGGNIFALSITIAVILLALHFPLVFNRKTPGIYLWMLPVVTGLILAGALHVRPEGLSIIISAVFFYITAKNQDWRTKAALILVLFSVFWIGSRAGKAYFDVKFEQTARFLEEAGGYPYKGIRNTYHNFWHPFFVGLGDFGQEHGYEWNDNVAFDYATPILKSRVGGDFSKYFPIENGTNFELTKQVLKNLRDEGLPDEVSNALKPMKWRKFKDKDNFLNAVEKQIGKEQTVEYQERILKWAEKEDAPVYRQLLWMVPEYDNILREKIIADILKDPVWFLHILKQRIIRILTDVAPARLGIGAHWISLPVGGIVFIPTLLVLICLRRWESVKLLCFSLPLALPAFIIYSGGGMTYYSIHLQIALAIYGMALWTILVLVVKVFSANWKGGISLKKNLSKKEGTL